MSLYVSEDFNSDGLQWSFVVSRSDVSNGSNHGILKEGCPFPYQVKKYIEKLLIDSTNMLLDNYGARFRKHSIMKDYLLKIIKDLQSKDRFPRIKDIVTLGDSEGIRIIIYLGKGYGVGVNWTESSDVWPDLIKAYNSTGTSMLEKILDEIIEEKEEVEKAPVKDKTL